MSPRPSSTGRVSVFLAVAILASLLVSCFLVSLPAPPLEASGARCSSRAPSAWHPPGKAPRIKSWLHACPDGTLRTGRGRKIRLQGLEFLQSGWGNRGTGRCDMAYRFPPRYAAADMGRWGFNSVQLFVSWQNIEPTRPTLNVVTRHLVHHYDKTYLATLDRAIRRFHRAGIGVVLSMMQSRWSGAFQNIDAGDVIYPCGLGMPAWIYPQGGGARKMVGAEVNFFQNKTVILPVGGTTVGAEHIQGSFIRMWRFLAHRYRKSRTVIGAVPLFESYDILTREYTGASSVNRRMLRLARFFERVGGAIHSANPKMLVMFTEQKSHTTRKWSLTRRPRVPNGVMTSEFYAARWPTDGLRRMRQYRGRAQRWHYPFYIDEFDAFGRTRNKPRPTWRRDTAAMLTYCRKHPASWDLLSYGAGGFQVANHPRRPKRDLLRVIRRTF